MNDLSLGTWITIAIVGLILLFFLGSGMITALAAYLERRKLVPLVPAGHDAPNPLLGKAGEWIQALQRSGFDLVGCFVDNEGLYKARVTLLLSTDARVLAIVVHGIAVRCQLCTRLVDGRCLITSDVSGEPDLSGLRLTETVLTGIADVLALHWSRLSEHASATTRYDAAQLPRDLLAWDRLRVERLVAAGYAKWSYVDRSAWSFTLWGSLRVAIQATGDLVWLARKVYVAEKLKKSGK